MALLERLLKAKYRFFHLNLINPYPEQLMLEVIIECELVSIIYVFTLGNLG